MYKTILDEIKNFIKENGQLFEQKYGLVYSDIETLEDAVSILKLLSQYKKKHKLIVHIGMHKTSSSSIQESLNNNLKNDDFKYINLGISNHSGPIMRLFEHRKVEVGTFLEKDRKHTFALLMDELTNSEQEAMIISAEDIVRLSKNALVDLKSFFEVFFDEIKIIGYIRTPRSFLESAFQQMLKGNDVFIGFDLTKAIPRYQWKFEKIDRVFGKENVFLWKFDPKSFFDNNVVYDFCKRLKIPLSENQMVRINESLTLEVVALIYVYRKYGNEQNKKIDRNILDGLMLIDGAKFKFSQKLVDNILHDINEDVKWMEKRLGESLSEPIDISVTGISSDEDLERIAIDSVEELKKIIDENQIPTNTTLKSLEGVITLMDSLRTVQYSEPKLIEKMKKNNSKADEQKIILFSTQRSGSTMVCDDIAGTGVMGRPSEYFIKVIENIGKVSSEEMKKLIVNALEKGKSVNGITAVKMMSNQIVPIGKALKEANISQGNEYQEAFYAYFKDSIFVRVIRNDKAAQAVSRIMARQTNVYHTVDDASGMEGMLGNVSKKRDESSLHYDFEEIKAEVEKIKAEEKFLDQFIERFQLEVQPIVYEEVVSDRTYVNDLALKLNVIDIELADRRLKKISGSVADEWVNQYKKTLTPAKLDKNKELPKEGTVGINEIGHRNYVGGLWDELGLLQISFLKARGLNADDILLDIACGPLRAGIHFIDYLKAEHYLGIDKEAELIRIGIEKELGIEKLNEKKPEFVVSDSFEFSKFSKIPDFSIAQSLFTHLIEADIQLCLINLKKFVGNKKHKFFATFFEADLLADTPLEYSHSLVNFFYTKEQMVRFGLNAGWKVEYIGDWNHPRNQKMMLYYQD